MPETPNIKLREPPPAPTDTGPSPHPYAELDVTSNFSFLRGASHPDELIFRAAVHGYRAIAITDRNSLAGVVRAYDAVKQIVEQGGVPPQLIVGARLVFTDAPDVLVYPTDRAAYGRLCRLLTLGKRRTEKGQCQLHLADFLENNQGMLAAIAPTIPRITGVPPVQNTRNKTLALRIAHSPYSLLREALGSRISLAASALYNGDDATHLAHFADLSKQFDIPLLATNHVHYHDPARRSLQDVLTCVRHGCTITDAGYRLFANDQRYLKSPEQMHRLFADYPQAIRRTLEMAEQCHFSLDQLRYEYPHELVPQGQSPIDYLRALTHEGARSHYGNDLPEKIKTLLDHELILIEQLHFEAYFLTVHDLVCFARSRGILCQGRGSAANSAVCYCLGITSVDPNRIDILFERFISAARNEPPDIDVDFEHERREEVLQYIYEKYSRERAGMTAVVITYRGRSAVRDVGKAMGLSLDLVDQMAKKLDWWHRGTIQPEMLQQLGLDPANPTILRIIDLTSQLLGFPRHLSQHVGGMVMTRGPLCELVPIENATMPDRTVIEWDKDDIDTLGILKVDALALGMLTAISKAFRFVNEGGSATENTKDTEKDKNADFSSAFSVSSVAEPTLSKLELHTIPPEDPAVYDMISDADTIGVFQIESRAQMSMLPRLRPRCFYDLVIEVAIVRPGPIQGDMVHPYLRRRNGEETVTYPSEGLRQVLEKTLGVPLFQEQAMRVAMVGAGFSAGEADQLRRAMAAWRKTGAIERFYPKIVNGMLANGYTLQFAEQCFNQIKGFGEYGFPESHAASFALLVYVSSWLKRYHPAAFAAALLNSQPMGFYAPAQIVRDAREHGVKILPIDINHSHWDCTLEYPAEDSTSSIDHTTSPHKWMWGKSGPALRLGLRLIKGLRQDHAQRVADARRRRGAFTSLAQLHRAADLPTHAIHRLAEADTFNSLNLTRRQAVWQTLELKDDQAPLFEQRHQATKSEDAHDLFLTSIPSSPGPHSVPSPAPFLPLMPLGQEVMTDYATTSLSIKKHPLALVRDHLNTLRITTAAQIARTDNGKWVKVAGLVLIRQRPGTASGVVFETLEDETGVVNLIIRPDVFDRYRPAARHAGLLQADGYLQRQGQVVLIMAKRLFDLSHLLSGYQFASRDFH
jgi:error-prone DNA polymerase